VAFDFGEDDLWFPFPIDGILYVATFPRVGFIDFHRDASGAFAQFYLGLVQAVTTDLSILRAHAHLAQQQARAQTLGGFRRDLAWRQRSRRRF
jgi:hypothetical protein